jgi:hypothetical protein
VAEAKEPRSAGDAPETGGYRSSVFEELNAERHRSLVQAAASVRAEGLIVGADAEAIVERWVRGELGTTQMRLLVRQLYTSDPKTDPGSMSRSS